MPDPWDGKRRAAEATRRPVLTPPATTSRDGRSWRPAAGRV